MESDAYWGIDSDFEQELGGCCINATLRDYARIGIFAMDRGVLNNGTKVLPTDWMKDSYDSITKLSLLWISMVVGW